MAKITGSTVKGARPLAPGSWTERYHRMYPELDIEIFTTVYALRHVTLTVDKIFSSWLASSNVTASKMYVLMLLWADDNQPVSFKSLGNSLSIGKASVSGIVTALVQDGWVERREDPDDRRNSLAGLTDTGRSHLEKVLEEHSRRMQCAFGALTHEELATLQTLLRRFAAGAAAVEI